MTSKPEYQSGAVEWDDDIDFSFNSTNYMQFEDGKNEVRIVSKPYRHYVHWVITATGAKRKVNCAQDQCPVCLSDDKTNKAPKQRFLLQVIDRRDGNVKLCDMGPEAFQQLQSLAQDEKWGNLTTYDVNIKRVKKGKRVGYDVIPSPKTPVTEEERALVKAAREGIDFDKIIAPMTPEKIKAILRGEDGNEGFGNVDDFDAAPKEVTPAADPAADPLEVDVLDDATSTEEAAVTAVAAATDDDDDLIDL